MFDPVRIEVTERLTEVRQFLDATRKMEVPPPSIDSPEVRIMRGLFFVHLYAALEFTINEGVRRFLQAVDQQKVQICHFEPRLHSIALESNFSSLRSVGEDKTWPSRLALLDRQANTADVSINSNIFYLYLQNIRLSKLEALFRCLSISLPVVPVASYGLYVEELVDKRNGIAHGRYSAMGIGGPIRATELQVRLNAIDATCVYFLNCLEQHVFTKGFIQAAHRSVY